MNVKLSYFYNLGKVYLLQNRSNKQTLLKNSFWLILAEASSKLLLFIITVLITRFLGVEDYGKYSFAFTFVTMFSVLADFGLNTFIIREIANNKNMARKYIDNILVIKLFLAFCTFLIVFITIQFLGKTNDVKILVYLASIYIILQSYMLFFLSIFQGFEKMQHNFISKIIYHLLLTIIIVGVIVHKGNMDQLIVGYIIANLVGFIVTSLLMRSFFTKFSIEVDFKFWKTILIKSWPFFAGLVCVSIYINLDTVLLSVFRNYHEVGLYQAAYKIFFAFHSIIIIHQVIYPRLANLYKKRDIGSYNSLIRRFIFYSLVILIPTGILITIFSKHLLITIYGKEYIEASTALSLLIWTSIIVFINTFWSNTLFISNHQKLWFYATLFGAFVNIVMNLILIPIYGFIGAAITTILSEIIICIFTYSYNRKILSLN